MLTCHVLIAVVVVVVDVCVVRVSCGFVYVVWFCCYGVANCG